MSALYPIDAALLAVIFVTAVSLLHHPTPAPCVNRFVRAKVVEASPLDSEFARMLWAGLRGSEPSPWALTRWAYRVVTDGDWASFLRMVEVSSA